MHKTPKAPTYAGGAGIKASIASNYASNYGHSNSGYSKPMTSHSQVMLETLSGSTAEATWLFVHDFSIVQMGGHFPSGVLYNSGYMSSSPASRQISQVGQ